MWPFRKRLPRGTALALQQPIVFTRERYRMPFVDKLAALIFVWGMLATHHAPLDTFRFWSHDFLGYIVVWAVLRVIDELAEGPDKRENFFKGILGRRMRD